MILKYTTIQTTLLLSILAVSVGLLSACSSKSDQQQTDAPADSTTSSTPTDTTKDTRQGLTEQLQAKREASAAQSAPDKKKVFAKGIQDVKDSGIEKRATTVGDKAPNFKLPNANGESVALSELLQAGPVVLTWYRGGWCPYCNLTLRAYQQRLDEINALGAEFIAISPEQPDSSLSTKERNALAFNVLSDTGNAVAKRYGIVYDVNPEVLAYYNKGADFQSYYTDDGEMTALPLSATYVIAPDGTVEYAFLDADYRFRADPDDVLKVLKRVRESME